MLWIAYSLPILFLGPFSGSIVDCLSKKKVLIFTNLFHFFIIFSCGLVFLHGQKNFFVYSLLFIYSIINQFNNPAELSAIPALVKKENLLTANNILLFSDQGAFIFGAAGSGLLTKFFSPLTTVFLASFLALIAFVTSFSLPFDKPTAKITDWQTAIDEILGKIKEGYQFLFENRLLLYSFGLIILFQTIITTSALILPGFSKEVLKLSPYDASYLVVFPLACGVIAGTVILAKHHYKIRKKEWIGKGLASLGTAILIFTLVIANMTFGREIAAFLLSVFAGLAISITYAPGRAFIQETTPKKVRGRIFGTLGFLITLATVPPSIFTAMISELITVRWFLTIIGLLIFALGVFVLKKGDAIILSANHRS